MKSELKVEFSHPKQLEKVIQTSYFEDEIKGRLVGKKAFLEVEKDDEIYETLKGLNNIIVRVGHCDLIDGTCRFIIDETNGIKLYPISMFCIIDDNKKYSFY